MSDPKRPPPRTTSRARPSPPPTRASGKALIPPPSSASSPPAASSQPPSRKRTADFNFVEFDPSDSAEKRKDKGTLIKKHVARRQFENRRTQQKHVAPSRIILPKPRDVNSLLDPFDSSPIPNDARADAILRRCTYGLPNPVPYSGLQFWGKYSLIPSDRDSWARAGCFNEDDLLSCLTRLYMGALMNDQLATATPSSERLQFQHQIVRQLRVVFSELEANRGIPVNVVMAVSSLAAGAAAARDTEAVKIHMKALYRLVEAQGGIGVHHITIRRCLMWAMLISSAVWTAPLQWSMSDAIEQSADPLPTELTRSAASLTHITLLSMPAFFATPIHDIMLNFHCVILASLHAQQYGIDPQGEATKNIFFELMYRLADMTRAIQAGEARPIPTTPPGDREAVDADRASAETVMSTVTIIAARLFVRIICGHTVYSGVTIGYIQTMRQTLESARPPPTHSSPPQTSSPHDRGETTPPGATSALEIWRTYGTGLHGSNEDAGLRLLTWVLCIGVVTSPASAGDELQYFHARLAWVRRALGWRDVGPMYEVLKQFPCGDIFGGGWVERTWQNMGAMHADPAQGETF